MAKLDQVTGKNLAVSFRRPHFFAGHSVIAICGRCDEAWHPGPIVLSNIYEVRDKDGADVTNASGLAGKTIIINSTTVAGMIAA
jgi:hypothetical protein